jgi:hypothetical protein
MILKIYFVERVYSPDSNGNPFSKKNIFFLEPAERPTEAPAGS